MGVSREDQALAASALVRGPPGGRADRLRRARRAAALRARLELARRDQRAPGRRAPRAAASPRSCRPSSPRRSRACWPRCATPASPARASRSTAPRTRSPASSAAGSRASTRSSSPAGAWSASCSSTSPTAAGPQEALRESEAVLSGAQRMAGVGWWTWTVGPDAAVYAPELLDLLGRDPAHGGRPHSVLKLQLADPGELDAIRADRDGVARHRAPVRAPNVGAARRRPPARARRTRRRRLRRRRRGGRARRASPRTSRSSPAPSSASARWPSSASRRSSTSTSTRCCRARSTPSAASSGSTASASSRSCPAASGRRCARCRACAARGRQIVPIARRRHRRHRADPARAGPVPRPARGPRHRDRRRASAAPARAASPWSVIDGPTRPFGVLGAFSGRPDHFTQEDTAFLTAIANVLSDAVERRAAELRDRRHLGRARPARRPGDRRRGPRPARHLGGAARRRAAGAAGRPQRAVRDGGPRRRRATALASAQERLTAILAHLREVMSALHPTILHYGGLEAALLRRRRAGVRRPGVRGARGGRARRGRRARRARCSRSPASCSPTPPGTRRRAGSTWPCAASRARWSSRVDDDGAGFAPGRLEAALATGGIGARVVPRARRGARREPVRQNGAGRRNPRRGADSADSRSPPATRPAGISRHDEPPDGA